MSVSSRRIGRLREVTGESMAVGARRTTREEEQDATGTVAIEI